MTADACDVDPLAIDCPTCGAVVGQRCHVRHAADRPARTHAARVDAARQRARVGLLGFPVPAVTWAVVRHGGRRCDAWRTVAESASEAEMRAVYRDVHEQMRQGCVRLVERSAGPDGKPAVRVAANAWAPNLRTRW